MVDIPIVLEENVREYRDCFAIVPSRSGRLSPLMILGGIFCVSAVALGATLVKDFSVEEYSPDFSVYGMFTAIFLVSGFLSIRWIKAIVQATEVLLLPEQRKIVIRRERTKKDVSEHSIDDVELRDEKVHHEDMSRGPMYWFTLYDTRLDKQIFAIRPTGQGGDAMAVGELEEFFNEVMRPKAENNG